MLSLFNTYLNKLNIKKIDDSTSEISINFANDEKYVNNISVKNDNFFEDVNQYAANLKTISSILFKEMNALCKNYIFKIIRKYGEQKDDCWYLNYKKDSYLKISCIDLDGKDIDGVKIIDNMSTFKMFTSYDICMMADELKRIYKEDIYDE